MKTHLDKAATSSSMSMLIAAGVIRGKRLGRKRERGKKKSGDVR